MGTPNLEFFLLTMNKMKNNQLPPQKIAVLIDGGFFLKRFNALYNKDRNMTACDVANAIDGLKSVSPPQLKNKFV
jgi:hypothetical protein